MSRLSILTVAAISTCMMASSVMAGEKHHKHHENGGTWNYNYNYEYENNTKFYNDPYFWGSAFGLLGNIITAPRAPVYAEPGPVYAQPMPGMIYPQGAECFMAWTQVYIPGKGYVPYQTTVCP